MSSNYKIIKSGRSLDLAYQLGAMTIISLFSFNAQAECTPTPDCVSIGYTETSCETDYLACPFDSTKLKCIPCDSSFRYDCSGTGVIGIGEICGGKYTSCTCSNPEYSFKNGECIAPKCRVGDIYYSDKSCSAELHSFKTPIGVVVKNDALIINQNRSSDIQWGTKSVDIPDLANLSQIDAETDYNGKENTALIVAFQKTEGKTASNSAAMYCHEYSVEGIGAGDWYLPAVGELYTYVYGGGTNYNKINSTMTTLGWTFGNRYFWSSSENSNNNVWRIYSSGGTIINGSKINNNSVICFLDISQSL